MERYSPHLIIVFTPSPVKHFWDHENLFEIWVVRATESSIGCGLIMAPDQEANGDNLRKAFRSSTQPRMLNVLIRIASMR